MAADVVDVSHSSLSAFYELKKEAGHLHNEQKGPEYQELVSGEIGGFCQGRGLLSHVYLLASASKSPNIAQ